MPILFERVVYDDDDDIILDVFSFKVFVIYEPLINNIYWAVLKFTGMS